MYVCAYDDIIAVLRFHQDDRVQGRILFYPASPALFRYIPRNMYSNEI